MEFIEIEKELKNIFPYLSSFNYDGIIVKKLESSNTWDSGRTTNQTHIAITGEQMDIFPYLSSSGYFDCDYENKDDILKKFYVTMIPVVLHKENLSYLGMDITNIDNYFTLSSVVRSRRKDASDQIQFALSTYDGDLFIKFRELLHTGYYLILLKRKNEFKYDSVALKNADPYPKLQEANGHFYKLPTNTKIEISKYIKVQTTNDLTKEDLGEILGNCYKNAGDKEQVASIHVFGIKYGKIIVEKGYKVSEIVSLAKLNSSYETEVAKGMRIYKYLSDHFCLQNTSVRFMSPLILYGPPGTGKTYKMQTEYIDKFAEEDKFITTFHQSFSYEEFVEGLKPVVKEEKSDVINYKVVPGVFYNACERAAVLAGYEATENETALQKCITDSERSVKMSEAVKANKIVLLCIDEINRANVSAVFGDLISLIEPSKRIGAKNEMKVKLPYSKKDFAVPANLMIIGTMNTADRSIQLLDSALRRRFKFEELLPDYTTIGNQTARSILEAINARIRSLLDKDHQIGHSYFIDAEDDLDIFNALKDCVIPLLEEYFYNDTQKIREILNEKGENDHCFYIKDENAQTALNKMQIEYDSEKEIFMLNPDLAKVKDADKAKEFIAHIV